MEKLKQWTVESLEKLGGKAYHLDVAEAVWDQHWPEITASRLKLTWCYDIRWAAYHLVQEGVLLKHGKTGIWELLKRAKRENDTQ